MKAKVPRVEGIAPEIDPTLKTTRKRSTIIKEGQDKPKAAKAAHYVDNVKFFNELITWQQAMAAAEALGPDAKKPKIPEYLGECVLKICDRLALLHCFSKYTYKDEMILNAIENCIKKLRNFNPAKTANPFAYFTQIAYYSFIGTIGDEKKRSYDKYKMILDCLATGEMADNPEHASEMSKHILENTAMEVGHLQEYVAEYDKKKAAKLKPVLVDNDLFEEEAKEVK